MMALAERLVCSSETALDSIASIWWEVVSDSAKKTYHMHKKNLSRHSSSYLCWYLFWRRRRWHVWSCWTHWRRHCIRRVFCWWDGTI